MINVLGLKEGTSYNMINEIWDSEDLSTILSQKTKNDLLSIADGNEFKPINPLLEPFIGVYPLGIYKFPKWWKEFKTEYVNFVTDYMKDEIIDDYNKEEAQLKETKKLIETIEMLGDMNPKHLKEGKLPSGEKIIKRLKKTAEMVTNFEGDVLSCEWNRIYETNKTSTLEENLVITNSISSTIGMSSYFENPAHSSCMTILKGSNSSNYARGLWANVLDRNSLIIYVTNNNVRDIYNSDKLKSSYPHQTMVTRYILRLVESKDLYLCDRCGAVKKETKNKSVCPNCQNLTSTNLIKQTERVGVVLDRAYPHNAYTHSILKVLEKICKENNLDLFYHASYNSTQSTDEDGKDYLDLTKTQYRVTDVDPIKYVFKKEYDRICENCDSYIECLSCDKCNPYSREICNGCKLKEKTIKICTECPSHLHEVDYCRDPRNVGIRAYSDNGTSSGSNFSSKCFYDNEHYKVRYQVKMVKAVR